MFKSEVKRGIGVRIEDGRTFGGSGVSETACNGVSQEAVVLLCFIRETEETEEDERAEDGSPSSDLKPNDVNQVLVQHYPRDLEDTGISRMGVSPGDPWVYPAAPHQGFDDRPSSQWDGKGEIEGN